MSSTADAPGEERRVLAPFGRRLAAVAGREQFGAYTVITVHDVAGPAEPRPGQFYMLATAVGWGGGTGERPHLPRPFSHCRVKALDGGGAQLSFMAEVVGPGTERLCRLEPGEDIWLAGPFGVGFTAPAAPGEALLVGGGIGAAPILALADRLGPGAPVLLGFRSKAHAEVAELFPRVAGLATDDGSAGRHALVTELLAEELDGVPEAHVLACGPPPMLEAVRALCAERDVAAQLALESGMACGYGACFGCVVPTRSGYARLCLEGPVLDAADLETAIVAGAGH